MLLKDFFGPKINRNTQKTNKKKRAHKSVKLALPPPLSKRKPTPPLKRRILWAWGFSSRKNQKMPGAHKIGAAVSDPIGKQPKGASFLVSQCLFCAVEVAEVSFWYRDLFFGIKILLLFSIFPGSTSACFLVPRHPVKGRSKKISIPKRRSTDLVTQKRHLDLSDPRNRNHKFRQRPPGLIQHVLTVLVFWSWVLLLPRLPPSSRSLR